MVASNFGERIAAYGAWRHELVDAVRRYEHWLAGAGLAEPAQQVRIDRVIERLRDDRVSIAFVAEFSRGKSELINAIFLSEYGQRVLPSSAGRTTMCPTELLYDADRPPSVRLLPIESRLREASLSDLRLRVAEWYEIEVRPGDLESVARAIGSVRETKRVPVSEAAQLGLLNTTSPGTTFKADVDGMVEIPRWRHAIVNIPHPLLELGLVLIDTPGLNAIGIEPELTLNLIPGADAVLFVLAADAGVTRSDIEVWRDHVSPVHKSGRFVVLNKIDGLWDDLRDESQIDAEIARQVASVAATLELPEERVFPVSAQKGLVGRIHGDRALLERSRLLDLEQALSLELVPQQQTIVSERVRHGFGEVSSAVTSLLVARRRNVVEQLFELNGLRGKNRNVVEHMATRIRDERTDFDKSLRRLQALRSVFSRHSQSIYGTIGVDVLKRHVRGARELMRASQFSIGLREGMSSLITSVRSDFQEVSRLVDEISTMMAAMYRTFNAEHGLTLGAPIMFSTRRYLEEIDRIEAIHRRQFGPLTMFTTEKWALMRRFFESVAARIRDVYDLAGREVEAWLRAVISPIEGQVREHQAQLRRRLDSVRRVLEASDSLDARIGEIEELRAQVEQDLAISVELTEQVRAVLDQQVLAGEFEAPPAPARADPAATRQRDATARTGDPAPAPRPGAPSLTVVQGFASGRSAGAAAG